jgi:hypothetical protein
MLEYAASRSSMKNIFKMLVNKMQGSRILWILRLTWEDKIKINFKDIGVGVGNRFAWFSIRYSRWLLWKRFDKMDLRSVKTHAFMSQNSHQLHLY